MLSRRIIRVKALQVLFSNEISKDMSVAKIEKNILESILDAERLYNIYLLYLIEIANYSLIYDAKQDDKILEQSKDENSSIALSQNEIIQLINKNKDFKDYVGFNKLNQYINKKIVKSLFEELIQKGKYKDYVLRAEKTKNDESDILRFIIKKILGASLELEEELGEHFIHIEDDSYFALLAMQKTLKAFEIEKEELFLQQFLLLEDTSEVREFAVQLADRYLDHEEEFVKIIKPKLKNWEIERIAVIDIVILKMAICELKYFGNIPVKVTINEYIDISKEYSSDKSKDFINGILDKIMKTLNEKGEIKKHGRGLIN